MRSHVASIEIAAPPADTFDFVADPERLPTWAIGFAKAIERDGERWAVTTASGERVGIRVETDSEAGVVDYLMSPAPGMPDAVFDQQARELERELIVLKAHLETSCPL